MGFSLTDFLTSLGGEGGSAANTAAALGLGKERTKSLQGKMV